MRINRKYTPCENVVNLLSIVFIDRSCILYRDSFHVTSNRRGPINSCTHCREYICAFTSNYTGRGNPVKRHAASSREDQRTRRHSVLLHSLVVSDAYNATFGVATSKEEGTTAPHATLEKLWTRSSKHTDAPRDEILSFVRSFLSYRNIVPLR